MTFSRRIGVLLLMVVAACFGSAASAGALGGEVMAVGHDGQGELGIVAGPRSSVHLL